VDPAAPERALTLIAPQRRIVLSKTAARAAVLCARFTDRCDRRLATVSDERYHRC